MRPTSDSLQQPLVPIPSQLNCKALSGLNLQLDLESQYWRYLNQLALETTLDWFSDEMVVHPALAHQNWQQVNGSALLFKRSQKTVIIIPNDTIDSAEMVVSDYWVDSRKPCGDYFFSIQINPEQGWLKFWGYTTCRTLKQMAHRQVQGAYTISSQALIPDIAAFSVVNQLCLQED